MRAALGQYVLETPQQLLKLLATMARNKLVDQVGKQRVLKRGYGLQQEGGHESDIEDPHPTPSQVVADREWLEQALRRLSAEERQIADLHGAGYEWAEIAQKVGGTADGVRMQLKRARTRVIQEIGLEG